MTSEAFCDNVRLEIMRKLYTAFDTPYETEEKHLIIFLISHFSLSILHEGQIFWQAAVIFALISLQFFCLFFVTLICFRVLSRSMFPSSTKMERTESSTATSQKTFKHFTNHFDMALTSLTTGHA